MMMVVMAVTTVVLEVAASTEFSLCGTRLLRTLNIIFLTLNYFGSFLVTGPYAEVLVSRNNEYCPLELSR